MAAEMKVTKITPVLIVEEIEPCLGFWTSLGFEKTAEVPEGERLGFVILAKDGVEVMYQSRSSIQKDVPALAALRTSAALFIEVDNLDEVIRRLAGTPVVFERRRTFYGADEIGFREPAGSVVTFAAFGAKQ